jgi:transcriptional regulator with XRE-family HTH domain
MRDEVSDEAKHYGAALRRLLAETGRTQRSLAEAAHCSDSTVSRYLAGKRVAPRQFLDAFVGHLRGSGVAISQEQYADLTELRQRAQQASKFADIRLLYWQEQVDQLRAKVNELNEAREGQDRDAQAAREEAAEIRRQLTDVQDALVHALTRAEAAEADRDQLADQTADQQRQLQHAAAYSQELEHDLAGQQERVEALERELEVLRGQVQRLLDETPEAVADPESPVEAVPVAVATPVPRAATVTQNGGAPAGPADLPMPEWRPATARLQPETEARYSDAHEDQQRERLGVMHAAWAKFEADFKTARYRLKVPFYVRTPQGLAKRLKRSTGDSRWLPVGEAFEALLFYDRPYDWTSPPVQTSPYGVLCKPKYELTPDTVKYFCKRVAELRADLNTLTDLYAKR